MDYFGIYGILSLVITGFAGGSFFFYKQSKRLKKAEATCKEVETMQLVINALKEEIERVKKDNLDMHAALHEKNERMALLYKQNEEKDTQLHLLRTVINRSFTCPNVKNCPVMKELRSEN